MLLVASLWQQELHNMSQSRAKPESTCPFTSDDDDHDDAVHVAHDRNHSDRNPILLLPEETTDH